MWIFIRLPSLENFYFCYKLCSLSGFSNPFMPDVWPNSSIELVWYLTHSLMGTISCHWDSETGIDVVIRQIHSFSMLLPELPVFNNDDIWGKHLCYLAMWPKFKWTSHMLQTFLGIANYCSIQHPAGGRYSQILRSVGQQMPVFHLENLIP